MNDAGREALPERTEMLLRRAQACSDEFDRTGRMAVLDGAIQLMRDATATIPNRHLAYYPSLCALAVLLQARFRRTGDPGDIDEVIDLFGQAVANTPDDDPDHARQCTQLADALDRRFDLSADPADLAQAVVLLRQAIAVTPTRHADRLARIESLGQALIKSAEEAGAAVDVDEVTRVFEAAVAAAPLGHPKHTEMLSRFGEALRFRFNRTGDPADLDRAIGACRQAADDTGPGQHANLYRLASVLRQRFDYIGDSGALDEAIRRLRLSNDLLPADDSLQPKVLALLGASLRARFDHSGDLPSLREAVDVGRCSVEHLHGSHPRDAVMLNNLGNALQALYEVTGDIDTLQEAAQVGRRAISCMADVPNRAMYLSNLANTLRELAVRSHDPAMLREAVDIGRSSVQLVPDGQPHQAFMLFNLGAALADQFRQTGDERTLREAISVHWAAAQAESGAIVPRLTAAARSGWFAGIGKDWRAAYRGLAYAVELLPAAAPRELDRQDQEHGLGLLPGLAADAAACALHIGRPERAVELLEQGRGVLISQALAGSTDLSELRDAAPTLAARFDRLREQLNKTIPEESVDTHDHRELTTRGRRELIARWDGLFAEIRAVPGLDHFGKPPPIGRLLDQAVDGPILIVNFSRFRSDALIVTTQGVRTVPLPALTPDWLAERCTRFLDALDHIRTATTKTDRTMSRQDMFPILEDLWDVITGPILDELGSTTAQHDGDPLPRVWWLPTGPLNLLPLHAAGYYEGADVSRTVLDRVVSSYIPTIQALAHARTFRSESPATAGILVTALPDTPGEIALPHVSREKRLIEKRFPNAQVLEARQANRDQVLAELPRHPMAHFACHASTDLDKPSESRLLLHDGALTVLEIARRDLTDARLAYLSACATTLTNPALADEAVHITAAFQLAGYTHVIGTLWAIRDDIAANIADQFYAHLAPDGLPDTERAAAALHHVTHEIRSEHPAAPELWASHIHVGP